MGIQFCFRITIPNTKTKMKFLIALCLVASAMAIEDTAEVAAAKAAHAAAAVASAYLDDTADVAAAKAAFAAAFDSAEKIAALPAPYFYNGYYGGYPYGAYAHGAYPYGAYAHGAYPYAAYAHGAYAYGAYPYAGYGYAGYPYVLPAAPAKEE